MLKKLPEAGIIIDDNCIFTNICIRVSGYQKNWLIKPIRWVDILYWYTRCQLCKQQPVQS